MPTKKIEFSTEHGTYTLTCPPNVDVYSLCETVKQSTGASEIKIHTQYETLDDLYVQGRSTRNLSDIPASQRQLELF